MTQEQHPITPPPELAERLRSESPHGIRDAGAARERRLIAAAYRAGADMELEACIRYFYGYNSSWGEGSDLIRGLRAARRPKPPSLKGQALDLLISHDTYERWAPSECEWQTIRRALEALPE